ncbi:hypothetical protein COEREDRAFT_81836 [Coemansia reversa NRRL 1564]|uniref:Uncharacterized protein n=1 Tax=Coemansia reversa (strain ATCC 12441 / NRRL 1564) TaxID=763665 RepID=A0A2G5B9L5_COERN|nr:hypothetical protein COEREDRAFT_81836 [Coemansia reversa NRRL 1564]|eukprot:PIA15706.1 hypothetical protein COEREDRAFT_81836 [Coemansia reversa NRRL 1564]
MPLSFYPYLGSKWSIPVAAASSDPREKKDDDMARHTLLDPYYSGTTVVDQPWEQQQDSSISESAARKMAQNAHELLASIRRRHVQLANYMQKFNNYKANPLGGAMCADLGEKIHQMALLIRTQQNQLKDIVDTYEQRYQQTSPPSLTSTRSDSIRSVGCEQEAQKENEHVVESPPTTNWLATIRMAVFKEVIDFTAHDIKRIEQSSLLEEFPQHTRN